MKSLEQTINLSSFHLSAIFFFLIETERLWLENTLRLQTLEMSSRLNWTGNGLVNPNVIFDSIIHVIWRGCFLKYQIGMFLVDDVAKFRRGYGLY